MKMFSCSMYTIVEQKLYFIAEQIKDIIIMMERKHTILHKHWSVVGIMEHLMILMMLIGVILICLLLRMIVSIIL